jgi:hypothetical protein
MMSPDSGPDGASGKAAEDPGAMSPDAARGQGGKNKSASDREPSGGKAAKTEGKTRTGEDVDGMSAKTEGETKAGADADGKKTAGAESKPGMMREGEPGVTAEGKADSKPGKTVKLESEQIGKLRTHFQTNRPKVKAVDKTEISVSVGTAIPGTIALYDLPPDVVVVEGACPVRYFLWGDDIVLVDSCTREVVEVIVGIA